MGKDYLAAAYRRTYEGDYSKAYKDARALNALRQERQREYEIASKKIGTRSYNKSEKGVVARPTTQGTVTASGPGRVQRVRPLNSSEQEYKQEISSEGKRQRVASEPARVVVPPKTTEKSVVLPPPFPITTSAPTKRAPIATVSSQAPPLRKKAAAPTISLDPSAMPIQVQPDSTYKDMSTGEKISIENARRRLEKSGFNKVDGIYFGNILVMIIVFGILVPFVGPLALFSMGNTLKKKELITYERIVQGRRQIFDMPAPTADLNKMKQQGGMFTTIAFIAGFGQYYIMFL